MTALQPYPAYRDSGLEWLGEVPEHWEVRRLKTLCDMRSGDAITAMSITEVGKYPVFGGNGIRGYAARYTHDGNFVLIGRQGALCGNVHIARGRFWASEHAVVATLRRKHALEWFGAMLEIKNLNQYSFAAAQPGLSVDRVLDLWVPVPPAQEQTAIARFFDHADRRIRRYIRAKERLIELLEEQKQAIIHQAVTGQIDVRTGKPYAAYKASGVEWLGEVPERWERRRSKRTFTPRKELARPDDIQLSATQAYGVIAQKDYEERVGRKIVKIFKHLKKRRHVEVDDFIISMRSFQGGLERAWVSGCIRSSYIVLQPATSLDVTYFGYLFKSVGYITALQSTANFIRDGQDLNFGDFCRVDLPFPPIETQRRIATFLDSTTAAIATTLDRYRCQIDLLREYRTRLIAEVVTGKLDVREATASLPDIDPLGADDTRGAPKNNTTTVPETPNPAVGAPHP